MDRGFACSLGSDSRSGGVCVQEAAPLAGSVSPVAAATASAGATSQPAPAGPGASTVSGCVTGPSPGPRSLPLKSLNHVSIRCRDVSKSLRFYRDLMGFVPVKRPTCLDYFDGAWLFNYGIGIHLLKDDGNRGPDAAPAVINPRSDHLSFQCEGIEAVEALLAENDIPFVRQAVVENGIVVDQLFFHDPDNHMIEICNCDALPVEPLARSSAAFLHPLQSSMSSPASCQVLSSAAAAACSLQTSCSRRASKSMPGSPANGRVSAEPAAQSSDREPAAAKWEEEEEVWQPQAGEEVSKSAEAAGVHNQSSQTPEVGAHVNGLGEGDELSVFPHSPPTGQLGLDKATIHQVEGFKANPLGLACQEHSAGPSSPGCPPAPPSRRASSASPTLERGSFLLQSQLLQVPAGV